jgi:tRNA1(Val) A37 N6-methylase TrmN6
MTAPTSPDPPTAATTQDALLGGQLKLRQPADGYRVAVDPILLAAAVPANPDQTILDAGSGVGAAALCLAHRVPGCQATGIEIQTALAALAHENAAQNGLSEAVRFVEGDIAAPPASLKPPEFDHVMTNPPYLRAAESRIPSSSAKAIATVEQDIDLAAWLNICARMTKPQGTVTVIHRADRLDDVVRALGTSCGALIVYPLWPRAGADAKRMIVRGTIGRETPLRLSPGLILHQDNGDYTPQTQSILRNAAPLIL